MARSFHRKKQLQAVSELNVTALIDLGFALLIIFMISTPLIEVEKVLEVDLPVADNGSDRSPAESVTIVILRGGYQMNGSQITALELDRELERYGQMGDPPTVYIRADADAAYQNVASVIDLLKKYRLKKFGLDTRPKE